MKIKILLLVVVALGIFLRFFHLGQVPPALNWDEASLGYNAYAIATVMRDEHGVFLPVSNFAAFGDYKPPAYIYATALAVKVFGLSEFSVRLTSALAGVLLVVVTFFLVKELGLPGKVAFLSALLVAISPWSLQMSRAAFEANLATALTGLGGLYLLRGLSKKSYSNSVLAAVFFVLAMNTFNSHRIFVPLIVAAICLIRWRRQQVITFAVVFILLLLPLVPHLQSPEGRLRFNEVTWLNDLSIVEASNKAVAQNHGAMWAKIVYNRRVFYSQIFLEHYLDHFRPGYLFGHGDVNPRLSIQSVGEMYWWDLPFILAGIFFLLKRHDRASALIFFWILLAPIPAALARETPHALRTLNMLPMPQVLVGLGAAVLLGKKKWLALGGAVILAVFVWRYLGDYYLVYPRKFSGDWQYGYKQMVEDVKKLQAGYDYVSVTGRLGRPYIYFLFYGQYPVDKYLSNRQASQDQFGFWTVRGFDKYVFDRTPSSGKILYVRTPRETPAGAEVLETIYDPDSQAVFNIF